MNKKIFIFSGEHSGDVHGANLIKALKKHDSTLSFEGVTGPLMRLENVNSLLFMESFQVMGFTDVLIELPKLYKNFKMIRKHIVSSNPEGVILIDYQEFSHLLSKSLRKHGYKGKIIQFISPSVWAWRPKRADKLAKYLDLLLTIYPFESQYYSHTSLNVQYVGNPIKEKIDAHVYSNSWRQELSLPDCGMISLFPGSRLSEIKNNLPLFLQAANLFDTGDHCYCISCADDEAEKKIREIIEIHGLKIKQKIFLVPRQYSYELMKESAFALAKSGTVTLELAIHQTPSIVAYNLSKVNKFFCIHVLKINLPFYCIANILANKAIFPEFIDHNINANALVKEMNKFNCDKIHYTKTREVCSEINSLLSIQNPSDLAAKFMYECLEK